MTDEIETYTLRPDAKIRYHEQQKQWIIRIGDYDEGSIQGPEYLFVPVSVQKQQLREQIETEIRKELDMAFTFFGHAAANQEEFFAEENVLNAKDIIEYRHEMVERLLAVVESFNTQEDEA